MKRRLEIDLFDVIYMFISVENFLWSKLMQTSITCDSVMPDLMLGIVFLLVGVFSIILSLWGNILSKCINFILFLCATVFCLCLQFKTFNMTMTDIGSTLSVFVFFMHDSWLSMICCFAKGRQFLKAPLFYK